MSKKNTTQPPPKKAVSRPANPKPGIPDSPRQGHPATPDDRVLDPDAPRVRPAHEVVVPDDGEPPDGVILAEEPSEGKPPPASSAPDDAAFGGPEGGRRGGGRTETITVGRTVQVRAISMPGEVRKVGADFILVRPYVRPWKFELIQGEYRCGRGGNGWNLTVSTTVANGK